MLEVDPALSTALSTAIEQNAPVYPLPLQSHTGVPSDITHTPAPHCTDAHAVTCSTITVSIIVSITLAMFTVAPPLPVPPFVDEPPVEEPADDVPPLAAAVSDAEITSWACCSALTVAEVVALVASVVLLEEVVVEELLSSVPIDVDGDDNCEMRSAIVGAVIVSCTPGRSIVSLPSALRTTTVTLTLLPFDGSCIS